MGDKTDLTALALAAPARIVTIVDGQTMVDGVPCAPRDRQAESRKRGAEATKAKYPRKDRR